MNDTKSLLSSKTVWSAIAGFLVLLASVWGIEVTAEEQETITKALVSLGGVITLIMTVLSRKAATKVIK